MTGARVRLWAVKDLSSLRWSEPRPHEHSYCGLMRGWSG